MADRDGRGGRAQLYGPVVAAEVGEGVVALKDVVVAGFVAVVFVAFDAEAAEAKVDNLWKGEDVVVAVCHHSCGQGPAVTKFKDCLILP